MQPKDPLAADDAIVAEAIRAPVFGNNLQTARRIISLCEISNKRGRAIREAVQNLAIHKPNEFKTRDDVLCQWCSQEWPCEEGRLLARIREILGGE